MGRRIRVLVVDDVQDIAETLAALVTAMGYEAKAVTDPRKAVEAAKLFGPDLVLLDIGMPHINGYDLAPLIREALRPSTIRIAAVTAWGSAKDKALSRASGFDAHLVKPISEPLLRAAISELLPSE